MTVAPACAAERFWSPDYIQHSAHIEPGREGLFDLIKSIPPTLKYEPGTIVAEGDLVIVHGRFSDFGAPVNWIAADIVRIEARPYTSQQSRVSVTESMPSELLLNSDPLRRRAKVPAQNRLAPDWLPAAVPSARKDPVVRFVVPAYLSPFRQSFQSSLMDRHRLL
jgi:hypothetical protein